MSAADHGEAVVGGEEAGARKLGDRLLAGIDEVGVLLAIERKWPNAQHAVLALQGDAHPLRNLIGDQGRDTDAKVDVISVPELCGGPGGHFFTGPGH
jgi:hypothetical protein